MNIQEFSEQFDTLYNQQYYVLFSMQNPVALDEFEKSVFLTRAQENIVETLYRAGYGIPEGFEKTEYARRILSPLVINDYGRDVATIQTTEAIDYTEHILPYVKVSGNLSQIFLLNFNMVGIIYEHAVFGGDDPCAAGRTADIIPVKHDDLNRLLRNPHRGPSLRRVLRLDHSGNLENSNRFANIDFEENEANINIKELETVQSEKSKKESDVKKNNDNLIDTNQSNPNLNSKNPPNNVAIPLPKL